MELILYTNFSKKKNSTKQPTGGTVYDVKMKAGCSTENPVFLIDGINLDITYAKWNSTFYFVDDIVIGNNNIYEIHCSIDVLATYRSTIGSYTTFVERSETSFDKMINDPLLTARQDIVYVHRVSAGRPFPYTTSGCFVIEVMNSDGIVLYACDSLEPFKFIMQPSTYSAQNIIDWIDSKIAQAFDLDIYIGTVKWIPFDASTIGTAVTMLKVGPLDITPGGYNIYQVDQKHYYTTNPGISLPTNLSYDDFRCCNPRFTTYKIYLPGVGLCPLDSALMGAAYLDGNTFTIQSDFDFVSGEIAYTLLFNNPNTGTTGAKVAAFYGNLSVNVPIGKSVSDMGSTAKSSIASIGGMAGAGAAAGGVYGALAGAAVGAISAIDNIISPDVMMTGGAGNKGNLISNQTYQLIVEEYGTKEFPIYNAGRPCYEYKQLSSIPGFIKCGAASLDSIAHGNEKDMINNYLNSGFYYE